jgi:hypothetical protein
MKGQLNPELKVGDRIMCYHMEGETGVPPGTLGTVTKITRDPFETENDNIINVKWDNGRSLSLITATDVWKLVPKENIKEQEDNAWKYMTKNPDIFENFDWRWFREYLEMIRNSGIVNVFGAAPLLYTGREHIDRYYGEGKEDNEYFQDVLDNADKSKDKIIQGVVNYMQKNNKPLDDMSSVNRYAQNFSQKILGLFMVMHGMGNREN